VIHEHLAVRDSSFRSVLRRAGQPAALGAGALYHPDATLSDPFGQHQGLFAIQRYFTHLLANVEQCRFTIDTRFATVSGSP
jgi:hypothetical protein